jgi:hypothetical protein
VEKQTRFARDHESNKQGITKQPLSEILGRDESAWTEVVDVSTETLKFHTPKKLPLFHSSALTSGNPIQESPHEGISIALSIMEDLSTLTDTEKISLVWKESGIAWNVKIVPKDRVDRA